jgi:hypothetical protein
MLSLLVTICRIPHDTKHILHIKLRLKIILKQCNENLSRRGFEVVLVVVESSGYCPRFVFVSFVVDCFY